MTDTRSNPTLVFDFPGSNNIKQRLVFTNPVKVIIAKTIDEVIPALLEVQKGVSTGHYAAGYMSYEAAEAFDSAFTTKTGAQIPLVWFGLFNEPVPHQDMEGAGNFQVSYWQPNMNLTDYYKSISLIKAAISRGETYQVNYTMRLHADFQGDDFAFYQRLYQAQRSSYCAYLNLGRYRILSASPELFFHWDSKKITTKPMKGTIERGRTFHEDTLKKKELFESEKNRAENVMIVDLLRNDLARIADKGSVEVPHLFDIEPYPTVHQMTSTVTASTPPSTSLLDVFRALFPCGSITGAPKINTMNFVSDMEHSPREVYCGTIGYVTPDGVATFNVAIRTVLIDSKTGKAEYGVGGGITSDSTAEGEYEEAITKSLLLTERPRAFECLETILLKNGNYTLLERHIDRLTASASYFDIPLSSHALHKALKEHAVNFPSEMRRVRLLVSQNGKVSINSRPASPIPDSKPTITLASKPISRLNRFLYHKTTDRTVYESQLADHPGAFDVLLWNEEGELTEFTIGNLVMEINDQLWTPPIESGCLPGTLRAELLDRGEIKERVLNLKDIDQCSNIWLINSVRGWIPVNLHQN